MNKLGEIDIKRVGLELVYKFWIILLAGIVTAVGAYAYARLCIKPQYKAGVMFYVSNYDADAQKTTSKTTSSDLATAQALAQTYLTFLTSEQVLDNVSEGLDRKYTPSQIKAMMSGSSVEDTEVFKVSITNENPKEAAKIANAIADVAPSVITKYIDGSSVKIIDYAKVPTSQSSPIYSRYLIFGGFIGALLAAAVIAALIIFNSKISSEDDIKSLFEEPVIGKIPDFRQTAADNENPYRTADKYRRGSKGGQTK